MSDALRPHGSMPGFPVYHQLLALIQTHVKLEPVMPSNHLMLCRPLLLPPSIFPSIRDFSNESALRIRWPKYWSFSFNIIPSNEYSGLISLRMDWLDLFAVQRTLKSLLQHHSSKVSILLLHSAFFVSSSHKYERIGSLEGPSSGPPPPPQDTAAVSGRARSQSSRV